jgi:uncharacterized protein (TIGR04222 family)
MKREHSELLERLEKYSMDEPATALPFSGRLAQEHGWTLHYAQRVIAEYKRFAFLAVLAGHPVSPSAAVDEAWHLHLLHTDTYWNRFCPEVLGTALHHHPSRGGTVERDKFKDWYTSTLASYRKFFGKEPPTDIWPPANRPARFVQLEPTSYWIIAKPKWFTAATGWLQRGLWHSAPALTIRRAGLLTMLLGLLLLLSGCGHEEVRSPLDLRGPDFLRFFLLAAAIAFPLAFFLRWQLRGPAADQSESKRKGQDLDPYAVTYLAGGKSLTVSAALTNLCHRGFVRISSFFNRVAVTTVTPENLHPVEAAVYETIAQRGGTVRTVRRAAADCTAAIEAHLKELELVPRTTFWIALIPLGLALMIPALGIAKIAIGVQRGRPVEFLVFLTLIAVIIAIVGLARKPLRTRKGDVVLRQLREEHAPLRNNVGTACSGWTGLELPLALGLFGMSILSGTALDDVRKQVSSGSSGGGSGGCGGGDGGGAGCGGGGCGGGCGGCGG